MVLVCYSEDSKFTIAFVEERLNATNYCYVLKEHLFLFVYCNHVTNPNSFHFTQDGAQVHMANVTIPWLESLNINVVEWISASPDLSPTKISGDILTLRVYANGFHFGNKADPRNAIQAILDNI